MCFVPGCKYKVDAHFRFDLSTPQCNQELSVLTESIAAQIYRKRLTGLFLSETQCTNTTSSVMYQLIM